MNEFVPYYGLIISLTLGNRTVAQFSDPHRFTVGEIVSFRVSKDYGTVQLNNKQGRVLEITSDTITVEIDSTGFDSFIYPISNSQFIAMVVPCGSGITPKTDAMEASTVTLLDEFDNEP